MEIEPTTYWSQGQRLTYVVHVLEAEVKSQKTEATNGAADDGKPLTDIKDDHMTSSQTAFLPYDVTEGE